MRKLYEGLILTSTHRHNELRGQSKLTWCRVCRSHRIYTIDLRPQSLVVSELQQYNQLPHFSVIQTRNVRLNLLDFNETAGSGSEVTRPLSHLSVLQPQEVPCPSLVRLLSSCGGNRTCKTCKIWSSRFVEKKITFWFLLSFLKTKRAGAVPCSINMIWYIHYLPAKYGARTCSAHGIPLRQR